MSEPEIEQPTAEDAALVTEVERLLSLAEDDEDKDKDFDPYHDLNPRQRRFVEEYLVDMSPANAAIRAGYSPFSAPKTGSTLLALPKIRACVLRAAGIRSARIGLDQDAVVFELATLALSSIEHYEITDEGDVRPAPFAPANVMKAIKEVKKQTTVTVTPAGDTITKHDVTVRLWDKTQPLLKLAKHVGLNLSDSVEVTGKNGGAIITEVVRRVVDPKNEE